MIKNIKEYCFENLRFNRISRLDGKYISEKKIILSIKDDGYFKVYLIDFESNNSDKNYIIRENEINELYEVRNDYLKDCIQCDSTDGNNFFCLFSYSNTEKKKMFYLGGVFGNSGSKIIGSIGNEDCFWGNIIKIDNENNKYLLCYQRQLGNSLAIECQYYSYIDNKIINENINEVGRMTGNPISDKPLMIYIFDNSIIINYDIASDPNINAMLILSSFDFKIKNQVSLASGATTLSISSVSFVKSGSNIYLIYEEDTESKKSTKIKSQSIKPCLNEAYISLSNSQTVDFHFEKDHESEIILFSLDSKINLYVSKDKIVSPNGFVNLQDNDIDFKFAKKEESGVFQNYYCYVSNYGKGSYQYFSLICPITLTICNSACEKYILNKVSTNENNLCTSCITNYYPLIAYSLCYGFYSFFIM